MDTVRIAPACVAQVADIPGIELAGATLFSEEDLPSHVRYRVTDRSDLDRALEDGRLWTAVHEIAGTVGFAMADIVDGQAYLTEIDVRPEFGQKGIGTRLVTAVVAWARAAGYRSISLLTFRHLPWNGPFYAKLGFRILDPVEHGPELAGLIEEEAEIGIDVKKRVAMELKL